MDVELTLYLHRWWAGELAAHYYPFGLQMAQFNKVVEIGQYFTGLLGIFEFIQFSSVIKQFRFVSIGYFIFNRLPWLVINMLITLVPKLLTGIVSVLRRSISARDFFKSIIYPHVTANINREKLKVEEENITKMFQWLAEHPLTESARKIFVYSSFAVLSLLDIFTS